MTARWLTRSRGSRSGFTNEDWQHAALVAQYEGDDTDGTCQGLFGNGAYVAILDAWLAGELDGDVEEFASMTLDPLIYSTAWAHGIRLDELRHSEDAGQDTP